MFHGGIVVANLYHSLAAGLIQPEEMRLFVDRCERDPEEDASRQFANQCKFDNGDKAAFALLRSVDAGFADDEQMVRVMVTEMFFDHILSKRFQEDPPGTIVKRALPRGVIDDLGEELWAETLDGFGGTVADWLKPDATLGCPLDIPAGKQLRLCWFSRRSLLDDALSGYSARFRRNESPKKGNSVRDRLGLVDIGAGRALVMITFPGKVLVGGPKSAQPTAIDAGLNRRFAAKQPGSGYEENRGRQWGTTIDLEMLAERRHELCGLPERVSGHIAIDGGSFVPRYLGKTNHTRGELPADNDDAYCGWLSFDASANASISVDEMIQYIASRAGGVA
jgi:hypothetical protein